MEKYPLHKVTVVHLTTRGFVSFEHYYIFLVDGWTFKPTDQVKKLEDRYIGIYLDNLRNLDSSVKNLTLITVDELTNTLNNLQRRYSMENDIRV